MSDVIIERPLAAENTGVRVEAASGRQKNNLAGWLFVAPFLIMYAVFIFWPVLLGLKMSFFNTSLFADTQQQFLGLTNYQEALFDSAFWSSIWHTVIFTVVTTPILIVVSATLAIMVNRVKRGQWFWRTVFFAPYVLPVSVVYLIWNWLYQPGYGLINSFLTAIGGSEISWLTEPNAAMIAVIILTIWWTLGFDFVLYLAGLQQIPREIYESSEVDGATFWSQIRYVTIPLLKRTTGTVVILQIIASLQVFGQFYLLTGGGPNFSTRPIVEYIYDMGFSSYRVGYASAMSYLFFALVLIITVTQFVVTFRPRRAQ